ncbi:hypothetical protein B5U98_21800 [Bosea sp. Tri-39]|nr:hypothetical protein BLM15_10225 [Bosea sp. Tri-49]RXT19303.1 hypothetical protein B5U98_21800 [Bosea sp. Tri-39]RXT41575.1 hypothetical protein B5U99_01850 [Bosea sp. Tri-54]
MAFDRPAFRISFVNEVSEEDFIKAVHQTLEAINTGILRDRTGSVIHKIDLGGKSGLEKWGREMDEVAVALEQMMRRYQAGIAEKKFRQFEYEGKFILPEVDKPFGDHMDDLKITTLEKMNVVLAKAKLDPLPVELGRDVWRPRNPSKPPS